jgi:hypothetical protein
MPQNIIPRRKWVFRFLFNWCGLLLDTKNFVDFPFPRLLGVSILVRRLGSRLLIRFKISYLPMLTIPLLVLSCRLCYSGFRRWHLQGHVNVSQGSLCSVVLLEHALHKSLKLV